MSTNTTVVNQWIKRSSFAVILLAVALTLGLAFANLQPIVRLNFAGSGNDSGVQRGIEAYAARYTAMGESFTARPDRDTSGITADIARYSAMAEYYKAMGGNVTPGIRANAARYTAMAAFYEALKESNLRHNEAYTARLNAMAEFYAGK